MFWRSINETLDKSKTIAGSIEGDFWLVFERVFVEPRPSLVDIGKIGDNDVEFCRNVVQATARFVLVSLCVV